MRPEIKEVLDVVKKQKLNVAKMTVKDIIELAISNEINLKDDEAKLIYGDAIAKYTKVIYAKKDKDIFVIKEKGKSNDLWYKYRDLGYSSITVFKYTQVFMSDERNERAPKKCEFIRKYANSDIFVTIEKINATKEEKI